MCVDFEKERKGGVRGETETDRQQRCLQAETTLSAIATVAVFDCVYRHWGTSGGEKGGVWLYSTESNLTPDTGYSLTQQQQFILLLIPRIVFIFEDCVWLMQMFLLHYEHARLDNACVLKTDPCQPNKTPTTKHKHEQ